MSSFENNNTTVTVDEISTSLDRLSFSSDDCASSCFSTDSNDTAITSSEEAIIIDENETENKHELELDSFHERRPDDIRDARILASAIMALDEHVPLGCDADVEDIQDIISNHERKREFHIELARRLCGGRRERKGSKLPISRRGRERKAAMEGNVKA